MGAEPGTVFRGRDEVRRGFELMLACDAGSESHGGLAEDVTGLAPDVALAHAVVSAVVGGVAGRSASSLVSSLRHGALAGCALPLAGALLALALPRRSSRDNGHSERLPRPLRS